MSDETSAVPAAASAARKLRTFITALAPYEAMQFDGTRESAQALSRAFPRRVGLDVEIEGLLLVLAQKTYGGGMDELQEMRAGSWLVRDSLFRFAPVLMSDHTFKTLFTPLPGQA